MPVEMSSAPVGSSHSSTAGPLGDGAGDGDALLLAARELRRESDRARARGSTSRSASSGVIGSSEISVTSATFSARRQARDEVVELEDEADVPAPIRGQRGLVGPRQARCRGSSTWPLRRHVEPADDVEQRRLAGARRPEQDDELPLVQRQAHLSQRVHLDLAHAIDLGEVRIVKSGAAIPG